MANTDPYFNRLYSEEEASYLIPSQDDNGNLIELVCKIPIVKDEAQADEEVKEANVMNIDNAPNVEGEKFVELDKELGMKLIAPLVKECYHYVR